MLNRQESGAQKRKAPRIDHRWKVDFSLLNGDPLPESDFTQYSLNISSSGVCFQTKHSLEPNTMIRIQMNTGKSSVPIVGLGRVAWRRKKMEAYYDGVEFYEVGVEFIAPDTNEPRPLSSL